MRHDVPKVLARYDICSRPSQLQWLICFLQDKMLIGVIFTIHQALGLIRERTVSISVIRLSATYHSTTHVVL